MNLIIIMNLLKIVQELMMEDLFLDFIAMLREEQLLKDVEFGMEVLLILGLLNMFLEDQNQQILMSTMMEVLILLIWQLQFIGRGRKM